MHKERILPWQEKGRWYHVFVESDGNAYTLTVSDIEGTTINGTHLKTVDGFHVVDFKYDISSEVGGTASGLTHATYLFADGVQGISLPPKAMFDACHIWVFGYFE